MKVLIFSEMFPKIGSPSSGIFVKKRIEYLEKNGSIEFDFAPVSTYDGFLISMIKKVKKIPVIQLQEHISIEDRKFKVIKVPLSIITRYNLLKQKTEAWKVYAEKMAHALERNFRITDYDIIHAHRAFPEGYSAKILSEKYNLPYIVTSHGGEIHSSKTQHKEVILDILENASKAIFVSDNLRKTAMMDGYSDNNSVVIPNGIDTELFRPMDKKKIRIELNIYKKDFKYVGFVGNLVHVKRADKLPEIFKKITEKYTHVCFIVVGDGPLRKQITKECNKMNLDVYFAGKVSPTEVPYFMNAMDVMILPSRNEGFGIVALEAQACGIPVVGSDTGALLEIIDNNGTVITDGEDYEKRFSQAVVKAFNTQIKKEVVRKKAVQFDWEKVIDEEISVYRESK
jgi:glycosyltransferase involved in cell wall biosynthesis